MTEKGFRPDEATVGGLSVERSVEKSVEKRFEDLQLTLIEDAIEKAQAEKSSVPPVEIVRQLVNEQKIVHTDLVRLGLEISEKIEDLSFFDELTGSQIVAARAVQDYLDVSADEVFGSGSLEKALNEDAESDVRILGSNVLGNELDRSQEDDMDDEDFDFKKAV